MSTLERACESATAVRSAGFALPKKKTLAPHFQLQTKHLFGRGDQGSCGDAAHFAGEQKKRVASKQFDRSRVEDNVVRSPIHNLIFVGAQLLQERKE